MKDEAKSPRERGACLDNWTLVVLSMGLILHNSHSAENFAGTPETPISSH